MVTTVALILILTIKVALGQDHRVTVKGDILPLDMALDSVDDIYLGCAANMSKLVETKYLNKERRESSSFEIAWKIGEDKCSTPKDNLSRNHSIAIYVYTGCMAYKEFNRNCRIGKQKYIDETYTWYSLQFLLTEAIQILKETQQKCKLTYRRTNLTFDENNVLEKKVRFGFFASSSLNANVSKTFGNESCFEITTCEGADISEYSKLPHEKEVLIPPYETFIVTGIKKGQMGAWCNTVFILKSLGIRSVLNCAVVFQV